MDSHSHPTGAAMSEWKSRPISVAQGDFRYIRKRGDDPEASGSSCATFSQRAWMTPVSRRKPSWTRQAPKHPVLFHAGPGVFAKHGLKVSV